MKRPRLYGDELDEDWGRKDRDQDPDRPSSHRRFYSKNESGWKGSSSSSYDRSVDEDRELSRSSRKRFEHDSDGFERRKGFDRYRDGGGDRSMQLSSPSPRGLYGSSGDRLHRSESFSALRREYPKGFRSERDRSRRDGSSGSSWRRSSSWKGSPATEEVRSPASDSVGRSYRGFSEDRGAAGSDSVGKGFQGVSEDRGAAGSDSFGKGFHGVLEDRGALRLKDSPSGEQSRSVETSKAEESQRESCSSSEMEEGELEPDTEPEKIPKPSSSPNPADRSELESFRDIDTDVNAKPEASSDKKGTVAVETNPVLEEEKSSEMVVDQITGSDKILDNEKGCVKESDGKGEQGEGEGDEEHANEDEGEAGTCMEKQEEVLQLTLELRKQDEEQVIEGENKGIPSSVVPPLEENLEENHGETQCVEVELEGPREEDTVMDLEIDLKEGNGIDLEAEPVDHGGLYNSCNEVVESDKNDRTLILMTDKPKEIQKDKGKSLAVLSSMASSAEDEDPLEGPSIRGFELVFRLDAKKPDEGSGGGVVTGNKKDEKLKLEPLDLSLSLPNVLLDQTPRQPYPCPNSPSRARSIQSMPSSFRTMSDGFTTSISFSGSQAFSHNPSCSLDQNSMENYEHSVGSRPIFQPVDQVSNGTIWQGQSSNEPKRKGAPGVLYQRILLNGNGANHSPHAANGQRNSKPENLSRQSSFTKQLSPTQSLGSHDNRSEHSKDRRLLTRERSSSGLFRSEQREGQLVLNGVGVVERFFSKVVAEPVQLMGRIIQEMTEQSLAYLKEGICEMVVNPDKQVQLQALRDTLQRRPDLTMETLVKCNRTLLMIMIVLKTGLPDFLRKAGDVSSSDLVEIFLNQKCRNLLCRSILPVDECDCKVCLQKNGFCSACMCLVCSKFDMASNTCSWVGCDVCLHWCHTDCGLRESFIRNGRNVSGTQGMTEMQFHCVACDHPSEMFGFVKEVFKTCAKDWKAEDLAKELQYVRRIFSDSEDARGRKLQDIADQMLLKLENHKFNLPEIMNYIMGFFSESESNISSSPSTYQLKEPSRKNAEGSNGVPSSSKEGSWFQSISADKGPRLENAGVLSSMDSERIERHTMDVDLRINLDKKPVVDELDSVVKFKQAEAKMYQERADDARREAEGLKHISMAKNLKIDEDYASRLTKLRLADAEERRRQKLEELQVLERAHREYFNMKMRMEADIKDLLLKMEATKRNFST